MYHISLGSFAHVLHVLRVLWVWSMWLEGQTKPLSTVTLNRHLQLLRVKHMGDRLVYSHDTISYCIWYGAFLDLSQQRCRTTGHGGSSLHSEGKSSYSAHMETHVWCIIGVCWLQKIPICTTVYFVSRKTLHEVSNTMMKNWQSEWLLRSRFKPQRRENTNEVSGKSTPQTLGMFTCILMIFDCLVIMNYLCKLFMCNYYKTYTKPKYGQALE